MKPVVLTPEEIAIYKRVLDSNLVSMKFKLKHIFGIGERMYSEEELPEEVRLK